MRLNKIVVALAAAVGLSAIAGPVVPLPAGPAYIKFDNREQIAVGGGANTGYANEINWGVLLISTINPGNITGTNIIESTGASWFTNISSNNAQITGIFYGVEALPPGQSGIAFPSTKGTLDLYWRDLSVYGASDISTVLPGARTSQSTATGYTEGTFLARLKFASGIVATDPNIFIAGSVQPTPGSGFAGLATSFAEVDTTAGGAWANSLNGDWFTTAFGTRDFRFRNIYEEQASWNGGQNVLGARSTDPATTYVIPEPATLALVGLSLIGVGVARRRQTTSA